ncbi:MAG: Uma2 family endonuclease, partial [Cyanobacteria bacterium J06631_9]
MTIAKNRLMSLAEYLDYDDGTDSRYELVDGALVEMGAEADINLVIESFLFSIFLQFVPHYCIRKGTEIAITGTYANTRFPDLMVLTEAGVAALAGQKRSMVMFGMPAPALVVEVVSS